MPVHVAYGFPQLDQTASCLPVTGSCLEAPRQFLQRIATASEQGDFRAAIRQRDRRREADPDEAPVTMKTRSFDLHRSILLFQFDQYSSIQRAALAGARDATSDLSFVINAFVRDRRSIQARLGAMQASSLGERA